MPSPRWHACNDRDTARALGADLLRRSRCRTAVPRRTHNEVERPGEAGRPPRVQLRLRRRLEHEITIEEATVAKPGMSYPLCIAGHGACPPEDAGGWPGYARLVQILTDPAHAEHQDMLDSIPLALPPMKPTCVSPPCRTLVPAFPGTETGHRRLSRRRGSCSLWASMVASGCGTPARWAGSPTWRTAVAGGPWSS